MDEMLKCPRCGCSDYEQLAAGRYCCRNCGVTFTVQTTVVVEPPQPPSQAQRPLSPPPLPAAGSRSLCPPPLPGASSGDARPAYELPPLQSGQGLPNSGSGRPRPDKKRDNSLIIASVLAVVAIVLLVVIMVCKDFRNDDAAAAVADSEYVTLDYGNLPVPTDTTYVDTEAASAADYQYYPQAASSDYSGYEGYGDAPDDYYADDYGYDY